MEKKGDFTMSVDVTKMPKLGFGMMRLPEKDGELDLEQICKMVDAYLASGMNYFDTAYMYCGGKSESIVKKALVERHPRESFTLTTKLPQWMMDEGIEGRDRIFNDQLARTGAGYFDYYLLHSVEDGANYEGYVKYDCFNWAKKKKEEGLIKHFGFSFHGTPELLDKILSEHPEVEIVQIQMNYADWDNPLIQSGRLYEVLRKYNMPFLVMEPVKGGSLASAGKEIEAEMKRVHPDASIASWALRFAASLPGVATVLSGMSNEEQMEDNIKTFRNFVPLNEEEKAVIAKAQELTGGAGMDLIIETAGTEITTRQAIHMAKKGSTIVLVGYSKSGEMTLPMSLVLDKELTFKTVFRYRHIYPIAIDAVASGKVNVKGIVTNIYDLDDVQRAMDESVHNKADIVKGVIKIHP